MNEIAREIPLLIFSYLAESTVERRTRLRRDLPSSRALARCASVSRLWQSLAEEFTFRDLSLTSPELESEQTARILSPTRLHNLRSVRVRIDLEPGDLAAAGLTEDRNLTTDIAGEFDFTMIIDALFRILVSAPPRQAPNCKLELSVRRRRDDSEDRGRQSIDCETTELRRGCRDHLYLNLGDEPSKALPELPIVSSLKVSLDSLARVFVPSAICRVAAALPHLAKLSLHLDDNEKKYPQLRLQLREGFARALESLPRSIKYFELIYERDGPRHYAWEPPSAIPEDATVDPLSEALFNLSQRPGLRKFIAYGSFDVNILGYSLNPNGSLTDWPDLQFWQVELHDITPSGQWMILPNEDWEDYSSPSSSESDGWLPGEHKTNVCRGPVDHALLDSYLLALGRAVGRMPALKGLTLKIYHYFNLWYYDGEELGIIGSYDQDSSNNPDDSGFYRPNDEVLKAWRESSKRQGRRLKIVLHDAFKEKEDIIL